MRWWTNTCPYCEVSLPVLERLQQEFGDDGLACKAVYHPKPPRDVPDAEVSKKAKSLGFTGPLAIDPTWAFLKEHYLDTGNRHATSVSFLLDQDGIIRFVHGGPVLAPAGPYQTEAIASEYAALREATATVLRGAE